MCGVLFLCDRVVADVCDVVLFFFFQAEDGIRDLVRSRGLGDVYKRQQGDVDVSFFPEKVDDALHARADAGARGPQLSLLLSLIHI